jgi:uncharacterized protein YgbK (DUF1537 family)
MSRHPVTPMDESDIRRHLAKQTSRFCHLMDLFALEDKDNEQKLNQMAVKEGEYMLFDTYNEAHLLTVGKLLFRFSQASGQMLVGSSGIEYALCQHLQNTGELTLPTSPVSPGKAKQLIIIGGSCSPTTGKQLDWAIANGFADIRLDAVKLVDPEESNAEIRRVIEKMIAVIGKNQSLALYTAKGPDDPGIEATNQRIKELGIEKVNSSTLLAGAQGKIIKEVLERCGKKRVVVAGGDTSGYVSRALGIYALETLMPIAPGVPLCVAHSNNPAFDGLEICLKGGQNGKQDFFGSILNGKDISS